MDSIKGRSGMLMTKGVMQLKTDPPSFVCSVRTFRHAVNGKTVTLNPIPNIASPSFFKRMLGDVYKNPEFDIILCEDGRLPFIEGSVEARKLMFFRTLFPFLGYRPCVPADCTKFDGLVERDPVESRMAYMSVTQSLSPGVDARARRAVERIDSYPDKSRVVCPWNVYHHVYFSEKLPQLGYELVKSEEVVVIDYKHILTIIVVMMVVSMFLGFTVVRMLFGF